MLMSATECGITLTELLTASVLAVVVAIGMSSMEGSRVNLEQEVLQRSGLVSDEGQVGLATQQLAERIARADRMRLDANGGRFRFPNMTTSGCTGTVPPASCLDLAANYQWDQYRVTANQLRLYTDIGGGCGNLIVLANNVTGLNFAFVDEAAAPPGGEPMGGNDNNTLEYVLAWDNGLTGTLPASRNRTRDFRGRIVSRAIPYSDVGASGTDSGLGLDALGVAPPPAACP